MTHRCTRRVRSPLRQDSKNGRHFATAAPISCLPTQGKRRRLGHRQDRCQADRGRSGPEKVRLQLYRRARPPDQPGPDSEVKANERRTHRQFRVRRIACPYRALDARSRSNRPRPQRRGGNRRRGQRRQGDCRRSVRPSRPGERVSGLGRIDPHSEPRRRHQRGPRFGSGRCRDPGVLRDRQATHSDQRSLGLRIKHRHHRRLSPPPATDGGLEGTDRTASAQCRRRKGDRSRLGLRLRRRRRRDPRSCFLVLHETTPGI